MYSYVAHVFDNYATLCFSIFMSIWGSYTIKSISDSMDNCVCKFITATIYLELWKRRQARLAWRWDLNNGNIEEEGIRPEYEAKAKQYRISPITKEREPRLSQKDQISRYSLSLATIVAIVSI